MDLNKYAALFLAESREHLTTCNRLLLDWEREPGSTEAVAGLFRAIHSLKGMAATMGYGRLADLAHRTEHLLDADPRLGVRRPGRESWTSCSRRSTRWSGGSTRRPPAPMEDFDPGDLPAALEAAAAATAPAPAKSGARKGKKPAESAAPVPAAASLPMPDFGEEAGRVVRVEIRPDAPLLGARAHLALRRAEQLGKVTGVMPPAANFDVQGFDGRFTFRLGRPGRRIADYRGHRGRGRDRQRRGGRRHRPDRRMADPDGGRARGGGAVRPQRADPGRPPAPRRADESGR